MDPFARPKIWPAQSSGLIGLGVVKPAVVQHLFILGHCLGSYGWHRERQSHAARAGLSQSRRGAGRVLAYLRREWLAYFFHIIIPVMMPAILVTTILGIIRSLEAFEIELLLNTHRSSGLFHEDP